MPEDTTDRDWAYKEVLDAIEERDAKLLAITSALVRHFEPKSENKWDSSNDYAWRLSQILEEHLSSNKHQNAIQFLLLGGTYA